jgi:hypothetical protein
MSRFHTASDLDLQLVLQISGGGIVRLGDAKRSQDDAGVAVVLALELIDVTLGSLGAYGGFSELLGPSGIRYRCVSRDCVEGGNLHR